MNEIIHNPVYTVLFWSTMQYMAKTMPMPESIFWKWIAGGFQFVMTNSELAKQNFRAASYQSNMSKMSNTDGSLKIRDNKNGPTN